MLKMQTKDSFLLTHQYSTQTGVYDMFFTQTIVANWAEVEEICILHFFLHSTNDKRMNKQSKFGSVCFLNTN